MSDQIRKFSIAILVSVFSAPSVLAADENSGVREISDGVYSFTLGEGNLLIWWNSGRINIETGSWASILNKTNQDLAANFAPVQSRCPDLELTMLSGIHGLTGHRNESGHKPKTRSSLIKRDKRSRTRFEYPRDLFLDLQDSTRPLRL